MMMNNIAAPMSFTAPQFTKAQAEAELASLTCEEARIVDCERKGIHQILRETPELREKSLAEFESAMREITDKSDYERALAAEIVPTESDPLHFIRCEDYDGKAAAARLANYWKLRVKVFGAERAFAPLTQASLTTEEVPVLREGGLQLLPPDRTGRQVFYFRRSALTNRDRQEQYILLRNLFYLLSLMCRDPYKQRHGFVWLVDTQNYTPANIDRKISGLFVQCFCRAAPIRIRALHHAFPDFKCVARLTMPTILWKLGRFVRLRHVEHFGSPKEFLFDFTRWYGMRAESLPAALGGTYALSQFQQLLEEYREAEETAAA